MGLSLRFSATILDRSGRYRGNMEESAIRRLVSKIGFPGTETRESRRNGSEPFCTDSEVLPGDVDQYRPNQSVTLREDCIQTARLRFKSRWAASVTRTQHGD